MIKRRKRIQSHRKKRIEALMKKTWKNTWIPHCNNKEFTVGMLYGGLKHHVIRFKDLTPEMVEALHEYLELQYGFKNA